MEVLFPILINYSVGMLNRYMVLHLFSHMT